MKKSSVLQSKRLFLAVMLTLGLSTAFYQQISTKNNSKSDSKESVMLSDITSILNYADAELEGSATFLTGLDDIRLIVAQKDVAKALQTNNKVESQVRRLKLPPRVAALMKKAYRATRKTENPGFDHKEEVAKLLVEVYGVWSDEDALQKLNFERWSDQIFDEIGIKKAEEVEKELAISQPEPDEAKLELNRSEKFEREELTRLPEGSNSRQEREERAKRQQRQRASTSDPKDSRPRIKKQRKATAQAAQAEEIPTPAAAQAAEGGSVRRRKRPAPVKKPTAGSAAWQQEKPAGKYSKRKAKTTKPALREKVQGAHTMERRKPAKKAAGTERKGRENTQKVEMARKKAPKAKPAAATQPTTTTRS